MLYSQGVRLRSSACRGVDGGPVETDPRTIWRRFAANFHLFRGTPSWMWLNHAFTEVFGLAGAAQPPKPGKTSTTLSPSPWRGRNFGPRALVRPVQYRGADDHREPARRRSIITVSIKRQRLERKGPHRVPARSGGRPRLSRLPRQSRGAWRTSRTRDLSTFEGLPCRAGRSAAPTSSRSAARRPIMAIPPRAPPIFPPSEAAALYGLVRTGAAPRPDEAEPFGAQMLTEMAADESGRRARDADPSGLVPRPQSQGRSSALRPRQGRGHPDPD